MEGPFEKMALFVLLIVLCSDVSIALSAVEPSFPHLQGARGGGRNYD